MTTTELDRAAKPAAAEGDLPELPLLGQLRLNLSALGIDPSAPDFGERLCQLSSDNEPYDFEISAKGELIVMPPPGPDGNLDERDVNDSLSDWRRSNTGENYTQTALFRLQGAGRRMPDAAWITQDRYDNLTPHERSVEIVGAPDFVVEVRSRTDNLADGLAKMQEWMDGGARLGWYLDPYETRAYIFRPGQPVEILDNPETLSGEDVLPGFVFEVRRLIFARHVRSFGNGD
ncbi:MAG: Uma2 family endonuclease [Dehalococcoidia bacterium]|nr:Uma2 family endonuclease [Dehalococcoidia bacterium]